MATLNTLNDSPEVKISKNNGNIQSLLEEAIQ
mgnify:FL=1